MKWNGKSCSDETFRKTGKIYRNFIALMYTYQFIKYDEFLIDEFNDVVLSLSYDYTLCLKFIKNDDYCLPGIDLSTINKLNRNVVELQQENISKDEIMDFDGLSRYVDNCMRKNPIEIEFFTGVMTKT